LAAAIGSGGGGGGGGGGGSKKHCSITCVYAAPLVPEDAELGLDQRDVMVKLVNLHGDFCW